MMANRRRLKLLDWLFQQEETTVSAAARQFDWPLGYTSAALRLLQSRGILSAQRIGRSVLYRPTPNPTIPFSSDLLAALRQTLSTPQGTELSFSFLTAFTHPRRLEILRALAGRPTPRDALPRITAISIPALNRHLAKLRRRGFVTSGSDGHLTITPPTHPLAITLLSAALHPSDCLTKHRALSRSQPLRRIC